MDTHLPEALWGAVAGLATALSAGLIGYGALKSDVNYTTQMAVEAKQVAAEASVNNQAVYAEIMIKVTAIDERQTAVVQRLEEMRGDVKDLHRVLIDE